MEVDDSDENVTPLSKLGRFLQGKSNPGGVFHCCLIAGYQTYTYCKSSNFHVGKYRVEIIRVGKFSWLITPTRISHQRNFTYTEYNPACVYLRDCGLRMNTREKPTVLEVFIRIGMERWEKF